MNMDDGSLLCEELGNPDWNFSAPHGSGRLFSISDAKNNLTLTQFKNDMEGIYSISISWKAIDESPAAYKPMEKIFAQIGTTVKISAILKSVYNFKAGGDGSAKLSAFICTSYGRFHELCIRWNQS